MKYRFLGRAPAFALAVVITSLGCETSTGPLPVDSVEISPATPIVQLDSITQLNATLRDRTGAVLTDRNVSWTSDHPLVAQVNGSGTVTGRTVGSAVIRATSEDVVQTVTVQVTPPPFAVALPDGRARIHPLVIQSPTFVPTQPFWVGWMGNEFLARFENASDYRGLTPSSVNRLTPSSQYPGWYETSAPVVGTCFTVLQFQGTTRQWADLSQWTGRPGIQTYAGQRVMKLADDGRARERLDAMIAVFSQQGHKYVRFSHFLLPTQETLGEWRLVGNSNGWNYATGRPINAAGPVGISFDVSGLRRYANVHARSTLGTGVWGLFGHFGDGSIDLSSAGCTSGTGAGYRHPNVQNDGTSAGLWLEPAEMPDTLPYLFVDDAVGKVWWTNPGNPPTGVAGTFAAATPWLSIVDDQRAPEESWAEIDYLRLWAVVGNTDVPVARNEYDGSHLVGGSLATRKPWFGSQSVGLRSRVTVSGGIVHIPLSEIPDSVWHVWLEDTWPNPWGPNWRHLLPPGTTSVWVEARVRIHGAAAMQVGWDYNRSTTDTGCDKDNDGVVEFGEDGWCEGGKSNWIFEAFGNEGWQIIRSKRRPTEPDWAVEN